MAKVTRLKVPRVASTVSSAQMPTDGALAAGLVAAGAGALILGLLTILSEAWPVLGSWLSWDPRVGALSGQAIVAALSFVLVWWIMARVWWRHVRVLRWAMILGSILLVLGLILMFPPIFDLAARR